MRPTGIRRRSVLAGAPSALIIAGLVDTGAPSAQAAQESSSPDGLYPRRSFVHPGILHTAPDLERMRSGVAAGSGTIFDGFAVLAADERSSADYRIRNTGQITTLGLGPSIFKNEVGDDTRAAYQNALMWAVTGDRAHADKARDILDAWSASLTRIAGADAELGAGIQGFRLVNAAELLRHTGYDGWSDEGIARCTDSLLRVWYRGVSPYALYANGNWDVMAIMVLLGIGVFAELPALFEEGLRFAAAGAGNGSVLHRVVTQAGQGQESGRDQGHEQLAIGQLGNAAQVAWNQGVDLWGFAENAMLANSEYVARYNLGGDVPFTPDLDRTGKYIKTQVSAISRFQHPPVSEMYYAHYASVRGLSAPETRSVIFRGDGGTRVPEGGSFDFPGYGTLTYAEAAPLSVEPLGPPAPPGGVTAVGDGDGITVSWIAAVGASRYAVWASDSPQGPFTQVCSDIAGTQAIDPGVQAGQVRHYRVVASNAKGTSPASAVASACAGLPDGWHSADVGRQVLPGAAGFDGQRFTLTSGGGPDAFRVVHRSLTGDGTLTARITFPLSSQYSKLGVFVRDGLDPDAPEAAMLVQGLPLHTWSGVWSVRDRRGGPSTGTGSTPVPSTQQEAITSAAGFPISNIGSLPVSATPLPAPLVEGAGDGYRLRKPCWVRVTRRGDLCTGAISVDGQTWTEVGSSRVPMGQVVLVGLSLTSCLGLDSGPSETGVGAFDNVRLEAGLGQSWVAGRPQHVAQDLRARVGADAVELTWNDSDMTARYEVTRSVGGVEETVAKEVVPIGFGNLLRLDDPTSTPGREAEYRVRARTVSGAGPWSDAVTVVMPRPTAPALVTSGTANANAGVPFRLLLRATHDPMRFAAAGLPPGLRLDPQTGIISGVPSQPGRTTVQVTAANAGGRTSGSIVLDVSTAPGVPWGYADLGDEVFDERDWGTLGVVALPTPGISSVADEGFVVRGAGPGLSQNGQGMTGHFMHQLVPGDSSIVARLRGREGDTLGRGVDRVGVLVSKSLSPFDQAVGAVVTGGRRADLMVRGKVAAASAFSGAVPVDPAVWLRVSRRGTSFAAAVSADGVSWTSLGEANIPLFGDQPAYMGLVVSSGVAESVVSARFTDVSVDAEPS